MSTNMKQVLKFVKLSKNAKAPSKGSKLSAGYDLYSAYDYSIPSKDKIVAMTDLQIQVPHGHYGRVAPISGLAVKNFIDVGAGVVDEDYRGNLGVVLSNFGLDNFEVKKGDRIAQLICERICYPDIEEVEITTPASTSSSTTTTARVELYQSRAPPPRPYKIVPLLEAGDQPHICFQGEMIRRYTYYKTNLTNKLKPGAPSVYYYNSKLPNRFKRGDSMATQKVILTKLQINRRGNDHLYDFNPSHCYCA